MHAVRARRRRDVRAVRLIARNHPVARFTAHDALADGFHHARRLVSQDARKLPLRVVPAELRDVPASVRVRARGAASSPRRHRARSTIRASIRAHRVRIRVTQRVEFDLNSHFARPRRRDDDVDDSQRLARRERHRGLARDRLARARHAREAAISDDEGSRVATTIRRRRRATRAARATDGAKELQTRVGYGLALARGAT